MSGLWPEIHPNAKPYYFRMSSEASISDLRTMVDEWDYNDDPHGYCHFRPMLAQVILEVERLRADGVES